LADFTGWRLAFGFSNPPTVLTALLGAEVTLLLLSRQLSSLAGPAALKPMDFAVFFRSDEDGDAGDPGLTSRYSGDLERLMEGDPEPVEMG
jgi:hypothetical protein